MTKSILKALIGEKQKVPPIWMMRQAGRYLPEYRETRAKAGDFLSLCYNSELAAEVTLQPIRRYGFDAAILFADILLLPQALGSDLWFETGEGPRLSTVKTQADFDNLLKPEEINETLAPVYETVKILSQELPKETTLIGFAGAPWTVATYMVAGRGTPDQAPAHALKNKNPDLFDDLIDLLVKGSIEYLSHQINAGAEVIKIFDSWAGSLKGKDFDKYALEPCKKIIAALKSKHPDVPIIAFPRQAGERYIGFAKKTGPRQTDPIGTGVMAWWISLLLLSMAALLWKKSCDSTDDVIALLERILATTLMLVVVLVSRNLLLETAVLIAAVQLPGVPGRPR